MRFAAFTRLLAAICTEMRKHDLSHFQEDRIVQPGCPLCRKRFYTVPQFIDHLSDNVLPPLSVGAELAAKETGSD
jgi:hypothetical protein